MLFTLELDHGGASALSHALDFVLHRGRFDSGEQRQLREVADDLLLQRLGMNTTPQADQPYTVGTWVTNDRDEADDDETGAARYTPAGHRWQVTIAENDLRHLVCRETGAYIVPSVAELDEHFTLATPET